MKLRCPKNQEHKQFNAITKEFFWREFLCDDTGKPLDRPYETGTHEATFECTDCKADAVCNECGSDQVGPDMCQECGKELEGAEGLIRTKG